MKKFWKVFSIIFYITIIIVTIARYTTSTILSFKNYEYNKALTIDETVIYDQGEFEDFKFGFGNLAKNGCGVVAVYNILQMEDKNPNLAQIIKDADPFGTNAIGLLGTNPMFIKNYLSKNGLDVKIYFKDFETNSQDAKYVIYSYFSLKGGHYQLLFDKNGNEFKSLNPVLATVTFEELDNDSSGVKFIYVIK